MERGNIFHKANVTRREEFIYALIPIIVFFLSFILFLIIMKIK